MRDIVLTLVVVLSLMLTLFLAAVFFTWRAGQWRGLAWFLNGDARFSVTAFFLGLIPGAVFGFVDQMALWTSIWSDEPMTLSNMLAAVLGPSLPDGELTRQAWGNLISDTVGTFCALMVAKIVEVTSGRDSFPMYSDILGVVLGCVAGIYIPRIITGRA
eukprot:jgi/Tetstr1/464231/TSEL_009036.t1